MTKIFLVIFTKNPVTIKFVINTSFRDKKSNRDQYRSSSRAYFLMLDKYAH